MEMPKIKRGTIREEDGRLFWGCERRKENTRKGYTEIWLNPKAFERKKAKVARACKRWQDRQRAINSEAYQRNKEASKRNMQQAWETRPKQMMLIAAKARAKKFGVQFNIVVDDFDIPEVCPLLGIKLKRGVGIAAMSSPELDRIIPKLGYVKGNVWVISRRANTIKSNASIEDLRLIVKNWPF